VLLRKAQKDDMGKMVQYGYTTGSKEKQTFDAAWNISLRPSTISDEELREHTHKVVSLHTLIWNITKAKLPPTVIADFKSAMGKLPLCDWNMMGEPVESKISIKAEDEDLEFSGLELEPPSGVCSTHYAR